MKETEVKYLAGLLDADGSIGFDFTENRPYLTIRLTAADSIDRDHFVRNLPNSIGFGTSCIKNRKVNNWATISVWTVSRARDLEMIIPRLVKHLVIKGKHFQRMFDKWQELRGRTLSDIEVDQLKLFTKMSRLDAGPLKPKKHPTWAWVAGYLDGDGSFIFSHPPSYKNPKLLVQATAHENDSVGLELLFKAFGGRIETRGKKAPHIKDWRHSLGKRDKAFAIKFLSKVVQHSRLKKHKIEQMLHYHNCPRTCTD